MNIHVNRRELLFKAAITVIMIMQSLMIVFYGNQKQGFVMDSKAPTMKFEEFLMGEVRYASLKKQFPEAAAALFAKTERDAMDRLANYRRLAEQQ